MWWHKANIPYWQLSGFYFFYYCFLGAWLPFWNLYLESSLHFSAQDIGIISAAMLGTKLFSSYLWGWLADVLGRRMLIIRGGIFLAVASFLWIFTAHTFWSILLIVMVYSFFWHAVMSPFEAVVLSHLKQYAEHYTQVRVWGSIGFIAAVAGLGVAFDYLSIALLPWFLLALLVLLLLDSFLVAEPKTVVRPHAKQTLLFWRKCSRPAIIAFFACSFLMQVSHAPYYTFYSIFLNQLGYSSVQIGLLWSLGVLAEVAIFFVMPRILQRYSSYYLFLLAFMLTALRWLLIGYLADSLVILLFAQLFHAVSFGLHHALVIKFLKQQFVLFGLSQGQALYSVVYGAGSALGALLSGYLSVVGFDWLFLFASGTSLLALLIVKIYLRQT